MNFTTEKHIEVENNNQREGTMYHLQKMTWRAVLLNLWDIEKTEFVFIGRH